MAEAHPIGTRLREWRTRRRLSQLALSLDAGISARHLSFLETGRARPSRDMLLHLADVLDVPLRARNALLLAAGFAPQYPERGLDDPGMEAAREAVERVLAAHAPFPALAVDRHWHLLRANPPALALMAGVEGPLAEPPVNVLRLSLHPEGLAPRILNLGAWRAHVLARLRRQAENTGDAALLALHDELAALPAPAGEAGPELEPGPEPSIAVPLRLGSPAGPLTFISTTTVFGTPADILLSELAIETFLPADAETSARLAALT